MKTWLKVVLIVSACLIIVGGLIASASLVWSARAIERLTPENAVDQDFDVDGSAVQSFKLKAGMGTVTFHEIGSNEQARVETTGYAQGEVSVEQDNGQLSVTIRHFGENSSILNIGLFRVDWFGRVHTGTLKPQTLDLYLPALTLNQFTLDGGLGDISSALPITAKTFTLHSGAGNVSCSNVDAGAATLNLGLGNVDLEALSADTLSLSAGAGEIRINGLVVTERSTMNGGLGNITLLNADVRNADIALGAGQVDFIGTLRGRCKVSGGLGDLSLTLNNTLQDTALTLNKGLGQVGGNVDWKFGDVLTAGNGEATNRIAITGGAGDIRIDTKQE